MLNGVQNRVTIPEDPAGEWLGARGLHARQAAVFNGSVNGRAAKWACGVDATPVTGIRKRPAEFASTVWKWY